MISGLQTYPQMKDSGIASLGDVPAHWVVSALRRRLRPYDGIKIGPFGSQLKLEIMSSSGYKVYGQANVIARDFSRGTKFVDEEKFQELSACSVVEGDLLVTMMGTSGRCAVVPIGAASGIMDSHLLRLRLDASVDAAFSSLLVDEAPYVKQQIAVAGKGSIMHGLNSAMVKDLIVAIPPHPEQSAIACFLDHMDRRISRYIRAKERLIALLDEYNQTLIHKAVTGQIDVRTGKPYAEYQESGVEWLNDPPKHWQTRRLKSLLRAIDNRSVSGEETLLSLRRDHGVVAYAEHFSRPPQADSFVGYKLIHAGQLVINRLQANNGLIFRSGLDGVVSPDYSVFEKSTSVRMRYLSDLLRTHVYRSHFRRRSTGLGTGTAGFLRLYDDELLATHIHLPSGEEQDSIVEFVNRTNRTAASAKQKTNSQIRLLGEFRARLTADVVTGKLDVREAAASLPDSDVLEATSRFDDP